MANQTYTTPAVVASAAALAAARAHEAEAQRADDRADRLAMSVRQQLAGLLAMGENADPAQLLRCRNASAEAARQNELTARALDEAESATEAAMFALLNSAPESAAEAVAVVRDVLAPVGGRLTADGKIRGIHLQPIARNALNSFTLRNLQRLAA